jgi:hypothetical protein
VDAGVSEALARVRHDRGRRLPGAHRAEVLLLGSGQCPLRDGESCVVVAGPFERTPSGCRGQLPASVGFRGVSGLEGLLRGGKLGLRCAAAVEIVESSRNAEADESLSLIVKARSGLVGCGEISAGSLAGRARVPDSLGGLHCCGDGGVVGRSCRRMGVLGTGPVGERGRQLGMVAADAF